MEIERRAEALDEVKLGRQAGAQPSGQVESDLAGQDAVDLPGELGTPVDEPAQALGDGMRASWCK